MSRSRREALVGGQTAAQLDVREASRADLMVIIPTVLLVIFLVLALLLRALVAPLLLIATVVLSFGATLGVGALVFDALGFPGSDPAVPLFAFVFLVAFGVLLDTLIVRSLLVPALTLDIGRTLWWPGRLRRGAR